LLVEFVDSLTKQNSPPIQRKCQACLFDSRFQPCDKHVGGYGDMEDLLAGTEFAKKLWGRQTLFLRFDDVIMLTQP